MIDVVHVSVRRAQHLSPVRQCPGRFRCVAAAVAADAAIGIGAVHATLIRRVWVPL